MALNLLRTLLFFVNMGLDNKNYFITRTNLSTLARKRYTEQKEKYAIVSMTQAIITI